jgi:hypothetical protein
MPRYQVVTDRAQNEIAIEFLTEQAIHRNEEICFPDESRARVEDVVHFVQADGSVCSVLYLGSLRKYPAT